SDPPAQVGRAVYTANCQICHKADLRGDVPEVPPLLGVVGKFGVDQVKKVIRSGPGRMPQFDKLSDLELDRLITFLRTPAAAANGPNEAGSNRARRDPPPATLAPGNPKRYWTGYNYMNSADGIPAIKPPFWILTAYDLNEGKLNWQIPIGEIPELVARGIRNTGSIPTRGGPVVTAGGLVFAPSQSNKTLYAYDAET